MYKDIKSGRRGDFDVKDYYHNRIIEGLFYRARRKAWAKISSQPNVQKLYWNNVKKKSHVFKNAQIPQTSSIYLNKWQQHS